MNSSPDQRIVMTLDAGGTNFRFSAIRGKKLVDRDRRHALQRRQPRALPGQYRRGLPPR